VRTFIQKERKVAEHQSSIVEKKRHERKRWARGDRRAEKGLKEKEKREVCIVE